MVKDPEKRLTCEQMLDHPWFKEELGGDTLQISKEALQKMVTMIKSNKDIKSGVDEKDEKEEAD